MAREDQFRFIAAPPKRYMRQTSPASAPRLFEWLEANGFIESVTTLKSSKRDARRKPSRRK